MRNARRKRKQYARTADGMVIDAFRTFRSDRDAYMAAARREGISKSEFIRRGVLARVAKVMSGVG